MIDGKYLSLDEAAAFLACTPEYLRGLLDGKKQPRPELVAEIEALAESFNAGSDEWANTLAAQRRDYRPRGKVKVFEINAASRKQK